MFLTRPCPFLIVPCDRSPKIFLLVSEAPSRDFWKLLRFSYPSPLSRAFLQRSIFVPSPPFLILRCPHRSVGLVHFQYKRWMANRGGSAASTALRCFIIFHRLSTLFLVHYVRPIISDRLSDCSFDSRRRRHSIRCLYRGPVLSPHSFWTFQRVSRSDSHGTRATEDFRVQ